MIFTVIFWYLLYLQFILDGNQNYATPLLGAFFLSYLFFMGFMKFYRRYTLECFMVVAVNKELNGKGG
jgi:hypothetical protein